VFSFVQNANENRCKIAESDLKKHIMRTKANYTQCAKLCA